MIETVQGFYSELRTTEIRHHKGFKQTLMVTKENKIIKNDIIVYKNHDKSCECGFTESTVIVFNEQEIRRTQP